MDASKAISLVDKKITRRAIVFDACSTYRGAPDFKDKGEDILEYAFKRSLFLGIPIFLVSSLASFFSGLTPINHSSLTATLFEVISLEAIVGVLVLLLTLLFFAISKEVALALEEDKERWGAKSIKEIAINKKEAVLDEALSLLIAQDSVKEGDLAFKNSLREEQQRMRKIEERRQRLIEEKASFTREAAREILP
jgi:hypothetical protein